MRWKAIGPGLLFAGTAVGVSHLVQATRAGAGFGLGLVLVVILAHVVKYPAFSFGPRYAAQTGRSLLEGYRQQGRWALIVFAIVSLVTMSVALAAITFVTAGLFLAATGIGSSPVLVSAGLLLACAAILAVGHFHWLDRVMKLVVVVLSVLTIVATILVVPRVAWNSFELFPGGIVGNVAAIGFVAALVGWMPSAIDLSVSHSLWSLARRRDTGHAPSVRDALFDFNVGYIGTAILALCFVILGAALVYGSGREVPAGASAFAMMVIDLYGQALGDWARPLMGTAALLVMFSTTLACADGFPRTLSTLVARFRSSEEDGGDVDADRGALFWGVLVALFVGALFILAAIRSRLLLLVDVATTVSFITAPVLAILNHRAVRNGHDKPGRGMMAYSLVAIVVLSLFSLYFLYLRFVLR